jgi:thiamine biosynthesis lipoprotein
VTISLQGPAEAETARSIEAGFAAIADIHRLMSFHEAESDLSRLNQDACDGWVDVDPHTFAVLEQALELAADSGGVFDPAIAPALVDTGFLPAPESRRPPDPDASWRDIELTPPNRVRFRRPLWIDLGGIAKGYAVDQAMAAIAPDEETQCVINAGGDLRVSGPVPERVLLRARRSADDPVPMVEIEKASLASSAGRDNALRVDGRLEGPHRDPRRRRTMGMRSFVSVVAESCMIADGLTKVVLAKRARSAPILRKYGATAYLRNGRGAWLTL